MKARKINNSLVILTTLVLIINGVVWIYMGSRSEITVGIVSILGALFYLAHFIDNFFKKTIEEGERKADMYRDEHMFENYKK